MMTISEIFPIEYEIPNTEITIRRCPPFISAIGNKPEYWYLKRPLHYSREVANSWAWRVGLRVLYWNDGLWTVSHPTQFPNVEAAYEAYLNINEENRNWTDSWKKKTQKTAKE